MALVSMIQEAITKDSQQRENSDAHQCGVAMYEPVQTSIA